MLNFRNTTVFFASALLASVILRLWVAVPATAYVLLLLPYVLLLCYGSYFIRAGFYIRSVCTGDILKKAVAITFDDGPVQDFTPKILDVLKENDVQAAFFCIGHCIEGQEDLLLRMDQEGHLIGNHSNSHHLWFDLFSSSKMLEDLQAMNKKVESVLGRSPKLFRPPFGVTNPNLKKAIRKGRFVPVGWSLRSLDTVSVNKERLMQRVKKGIRPGAILLFHDTCQITLDILPDLIRHLRSNGFEIIRLDKMCNLQPYV